MAENNQKAEELIRRIERAFIKVRLEDGVSMAQARAKDDWKSAEESLRARKQDREKTWLDLTDDKIAHYCDVMPWLDAKGFTFYLPAFMRWMLRHPDRDSVAGQFTIRMLTLVERSKRGPVVREGYEGRYQLLSKQQRLVIADFLKFLTTNVVRWADDARTALDEYWSK